MRVFFFVFFCAMDLYHALLLWTLFTALLNKSTWWSCLEFSWEFLSCVSCSQHVCSFNWHISQMGATAYPFDLQMNQCSFWIALLNSECKHWLGKICFCCWIKLLYLRLIQTCWLDVFCIASTVTKGHCFLSALFTLHQSPWVLSSAEKLILFTSFCSGPELTWRLCVLSVSAHCSQAVVHKSEFKS